MTNHGNSCGSSGPISWKWALVLVLIAVIVGAFLSSCATKTTTVMKPKHSAEGYASWYGPRFHGKKTANGERYNQNDMTAAHKKLPFGTKVRVINLNNNKSVIVRINDRGPYVRGRIIDVSKKAAMELAMLGSGTAPVRIETLEVVEVTPAKKQRSRFARGSHKRVPK
jgi:rare lipoprotein A